MFSIGHIIKCPQHQCGRALIDHEIQKICGIEKYNVWQNLIIRKSPGDPEFIIPKVGWICDMCTFLNKPFLKFCDTCNDNRPSDYQIPRFYEPSDDEKLIAKQDAEEKQKLEIEIMQQETEKIERLQELKNLSRQSVTFSHEVIECPICVMDYEPGEAIILHSCLHTVCKDCLKNYLLNIEDAQVKCPTENCIGLVEDREIESILSVDEFNKYQDLNLRMAEAKETLSFHCKAVNCTAWIINEGNIDKFKCPKCNAINCVKCEAIHAQQTCQEYQLIRTMAAKDPLQSKNDLYIQSLIDSGNAMKCPGCRMIVEKNRGCDGVLCRGCGMMICWATKGPRWGPKGKGDRSGGCGCRFLWGRRCHPNCHYCH